MKFKNWLVNEMVDPPQMATLAQIEPRVEPQFREWLDELYRGDEDVLRQHFADNEWRLEHLNEMLGEQYSINVREDGLIEFYTLDRDAEHIIGDLPVVVYHHTSSALDNKIAREGIKASTEAGVRSVNPYKNSRAGVYVTTETSGPAVDGYLYKACQVYKGNGRTWTIRTTLDSLAPDPDDADIRSGNHQFILPYVAPQDLVGKD